MEEDEKPRNRFVLYEDEFELIQPDETGDV